MEIKNDWLDIINPKIDLLWLWFEPRQTKDINWKLHDITEYVLTVIDYEVWITYYVRDKSFYIYLDDWVMDWDKCCKIIYPKTTEELQALINIFKK